MNETAKKARSRYMVGYQKTHRTKICLCLMNSTDCELIERIRGEENRNGTIKKVLKEHYGIK